MALSLAGRAPDRSIRARLLAVSTVKLPVISPEPPRIGPSIRGEDRILLSMTMANSLPTFSKVVSPNRLAPMPLKRKAIDGRPFWSVDCWALVSISPETTARRLTTCCWPDSELGRTTSSGGIWPLAASCGVTESSTIWKVSLAVWPMTALRRSGSHSPGASTTIRSVPA